MLTFTAADCPVKCHVEYKPDGSTVHHYETVTGQMFQMPHRDSFDPSGPIQFLDEREWVPSDAYKQMREQALHELVQLTAKLGVNHEQVIQARDAVMSMWHDAHVPTEHRVDITHTDYHKYVKARNARALQAVNARKALRKPT